MVLTPTGNLLPRAYLRGLSLVRYFSICLLMISLSYLITHKDLKLFRMIQSPGDALLLQEDLERLLSWSSLWKLSLNPSKCKVLTLTLNPFITDLFQQDVPLVTEFPAQSSMNSHITAQQYASIFRHFF